MRIEVLDDASVLSKWIAPLLLAYFVLLPGEKVIPLKRNNWLGPIVTLIMPAPGPLLGVSSLIIVASVTLGLQEGPTIAVAPWSVIPFLISKCEVHLNVPAGSVIVSPSRAALCKARRLPSDPSER